MAIERSLQCVNDNKRKATMADTNSILDGCGLRDGRRRADFFGFAMDL
jgi:hypothetical protein